MASGRSRFHSLVSKAYFGINIVELQVLLSESLPVNWLVGRSVSWSVDQLHFVVFENLPYCTNLDVNFSLQNTAVSEYLQHCFNDCICVKCVINHLKPSGICDTCFKNQQFCILHTECICRFHIVLSKQRVYSQTELTNLSL